MQQQTGLSILLRLILVVGLCAGLNPVWAHHDTGEDTTRDHPYTNRLADSRNPYLLLHAHNPVDWFPWGEEAIAKAQAENKPIFLSVGYSTCYWCHVAERMLYSNPDIAKLMNEWFVNVKVDKEQRPDLDSVYMLARHLMTGRGGWPNNVFLTPDLKPFFAGSYFPPEDDPARGPGFPRVLRSVHQAWTQDPDRVLQLAGRVFKAMQGAQGGEGIGAAGERVTFEPIRWLERGRDALLANADLELGGFRPGPSGEKFPRVPALGVLLARARDAADARALDALTKTLDAMAAGGVYDQLGGGFHRYSTQPDWSVPHFEKMLYDNAQLLELYGKAYELTGRRLYRRVAEQAAEFLVRDMMSERGGFFTALDAEVDGREGASYLWTPQEIDRVLGREDAAAFLDVYALARMPPNADEDGRVLRIRSDLAGASASGAALVDRLAALDAARRRLFAAREQRPQPLRDEKIILALNGLTIQAFARSGKTLQNAHYLAVAKRAAERLWRLAFDADSGLLKHEIFHGHAQTFGFLDDYALFGSGLLALYESNGGLRWRARAERLADALLSRFMRADGSLLTTQATRLLIAPGEIGDNVSPSGTSATIDFLLRLSAAGDAPRYAEAAARIVNRLSTRIENAPEAWAATIVTLSLHNTDALRKFAREARSVTAPAAIQTADRVHAAVVLRSTPQHDEIVVTLQIDAGYHVNANPASLDYLIPTRVDFEALMPTRVDYPRPVQFAPAFSPETLDVYEDTVHITALFRPGSVSDVETLLGALTVQACTEELCLPPSTIPLSVPSSNQIAANTAGNDRLTREQAFKSLANAGQGALTRVQSFPSRGTRHLTEGQLYDYGTRFPTSGPHDPRATAAGFYDEPQPPTEIVHALEHGNVVIYFDKPGEKAIQSLRSWTDLYNGAWDGIVVLPARGLGQSVVLTAWRKKLELEEFQAPAAAAFIDAFRGRGPEHPVR